MVDTLLKHIDFLQNTITTLVGKALPQPNPPAMVNHPICNHSQTVTPSSIPTMLQPKEQHIPATPLSPLQQQQQPPQPKPPTSEASLPSSSPTKKAKQHSKKQVLIVGDSMLNCIEEKDMRRDAFVRVRNHPGATVEDLADHIRAHTRHVKHDGVIILAGTNDISRNNHESNKDNPKRDTSAHMQELIKQIKDCTSPDTHIAICQVTARKDKPGIMKDVNELNQKFKLLAQREQVGFVSTSYFRQEHCGKKGVHPSEEGIDIIFETLEKYVRKISRL